MQWLIDIIAERVIATIGVPPCYIGRFPTGGKDFEDEDLTIDGAWHTLDLSAIVPAGAKGVCLRLKFISDVVGPFIRFRIPGSTQTPHTCMGSIQVSSVYSHSTPTVGIDANRHLDYYIWNNAGIDISMTVRGWIL